MIVALTVSGIDIPESDPSLDKEDSEDCKMAANRKNPKTTKTNMKGGVAPGDQVFYFL